MKAALKRRYRWLLAGALAMGSLMAMRLSVSGQSESNTKTKPAEPTVASAPSRRQVTVFAILATPRSGEIDPRLASVQGQLRKVLPDHGFKLKDVQSKQIEVGQAVTCDLGEGYKAETILLKTLDDNAKVQLRCNLALNGKKEFSTLVKTPANQLFFYERTLRGGTRILIGVGAR